MTKILVVDDDQDMTKMLEKFLTNEGYQVAVAATGAAALSAASSMEPELVLLDIVLGVEDGREILRDLRSISDVPVIFLTGRGLETERIAGLKLGADDYIVKPFSLGEVSARIETVLRRSGVNTAQHAIERPDISYGDLQINENTHEVRLAGELPRAHLEGVLAAELPRGHAPPGLHSLPTPRARVGVIERVAERGDGDRAHPAPAGQDRVRPGSPQVDQDGARGRLSLRAPAQLAAYQLTGREPMPRKNGWGMYVGENPSTRCRFGRRSVMTSRTTLPSRRARGAPMQA